MEFMQLLPIFGGVLLIVSLAAAWLLVLVRYLELGPAKKLIKDDQELLRCHIDYLLMSLLLLVMAALRLRYPEWMIVSACIGAVTNPFMFFVLAVNPQVDKSPFGIFGLASTLSFVLTTAGFGGAAYYIITNLGF